jgi:hypothetical protein
MQTVRQIPAKSQLEVGVHMRRAVILRLRTVLRPLRFWHLASLDAPTVAVVWACAFARAAAVQLPPHVPLLLALVTWTLYVADRLLDAARAGKTPATNRLRQRHHFHWRHRWVLGPMAIAAAAVSAALIVTLMPPAFRERNSVLAAVAMVYFTRVHAGTPKTLPPFRLRVPALLRSKELWVGVLFTAGCALPTLGRMAVGSPRLAGLWLAVAFFALLAWLNCYAIDRWENAPGRAHLARTGTLLALLGLVFACAAAWLTAPAAVALLVAGSASAGLLAVLDRVRQRLSPLALRSAADLVLLAPAVLLWR